MKAYFGTTVFARKCDVTGKGMNEGFCFFDGEAYAIDEKSACELSVKYGFDNMYHAYEMDAYYFTEWEFEDVMYQGHYFDENGNEIDFI